MTIKTVETASPIDEVPIDELHSVADLRQCPLQKKYWKYMSRPDAVTSLTFEDWLQWRAAYFELRELDEETMRYPKFSKWLLEITTQECYAAYDPAATPASTSAIVTEIDLAWNLHDTPVPAPDDIAPKQHDTPVLAFDADSAPTPKVAAPKRVTRLKRRKVFDKRTLTYAESQLLKSGVLPPTVTDWRLIKLGRRQRTWLEDARHGKRPKVASLMKRPRSLATA